VCDDVDAFSLSFPAGTVAFSLAPGSPTLPLGPSSAADLGGLPPLAPPAPVLVTAATLGLGLGDDVTALESLANPCAVAPSGDADQDGVGACDNCPAVFNPGQDDSDGDASGDACDPCTDLDADGAENPGFLASTCPPDNCPFTANPGNPDADGDGDGDACDLCTDTDGDGFGNPGFPFNTCALDNCPSTPNAQADGDGDGVGDVCDNCPAAPNPGQADGDGDTLGDACDVCTGPVGIVAARLVLSKLGIPGGERLSVKGQLAFPGPLLPPLDLVQKGLRLELVDVGAAATLLDHSIPGGTVGTHCGAKDGWTANANGTSQRYKNLTDQIPPGCAPSSGLGIARVKAKDRSASLAGVKVRLSGRNGSYGPVVGPLRITVVLGGPAESAAGQCGTHTFAACTFSGTTVVCR
jgi:hypothetical protein